MNTYGPSGVPGNGAEKKETDLNSLLPDCLKKLQAGAAGVQVIARCEHLPVVRGEKAGLARLFDSVFTVILSVTPPSGKLFVHIRCREEEAPKEAEVPRFTLEFKTSAPVDGGGIEGLQDTLNECKTLTERFHGRFHFNTIAHSGCLIALSLPGKTH